MAKFLVFSIDVHNEVIRRAPFETEVESAEDALLHYFMCDAGDHTAAPEDYDWLEEQLPITTKRKISYCGNDDYRFIIQQLD